MKVSGKIQDPAALPPRKPAISFSTRWAGNWAGFKLVWRLRKKGTFVPSGKRTMLPSWWRRRKSGYNVNI